MSAIELFHQDGKPAGIWYCSHCRVVNLDQQAAQDCHEPRVCACGNALGIYERGNCTACRSIAWKQEQREKEAARFEAAAKLNHAEYDGQLFVEGLSHEFFASVDDIHDVCEGLECRPPVYAWACTDEGVPHATSENVICNCLDGMWEDADASDLNGLEELETAIAAFNQANENIAVWHPDYTRAVMMPTEDASPLVRP